MELVEEVVGDSEDKPFAPCERLPLSSGGLYNTQTMWMRSEQTMMKINVEDRCRNLT